VPEALTGIASMAMRHALAELAQAYEAETGRRVALVCTGGVDAARRVEAGEAFDFVVLAASAIEALAAKGNVDARGGVDLARSPMAIAVKAGAPRIDVSSEAAVRAATLRAARIGYSTGPSGTHLARLLERWGSTQAVAGRMVQAPPGVPVGELIARGDVDIGFQQLSELTGLPGVDVVGTLPAEIQQMTAFRGAVCSTARDVDGARGFLGFAASPQTAPLKRRHGLEPAPGS
jgi:molybdate transport system substrate-binding protein